MTKTCFQCGAENGETAGLCATCGTALPVGGEPTAWDLRRETGFVAALTGTVAGVLRAPGQFCGNLAGERGHGGAILLAVVCGFFGSLLSSIWTMAFSAAATQETLRMFLERLTGQAPTPDFIESLFRIIIVGGVVLSPLTSIIGLYIWAGFVQLMLAIFKVPGRRFSLTVLLVACAQVSQVALVLPELGGLLAMVLFMIFLTAGLATRYRMTRGRALAAIFVPPMVLFLLLILINSGLAALGSSLS